MDVIKREENKLEKDKDELENKLMRQRNEFEAEVKEVCLKIEDLPKNYT